MLFRVVVRFLIRSGSVHGREDEGFFSVSACLFFPSFSDHLSIIYRCYFYFLSCEEAWRLVIHGSWDMGHGL